MAPLAVSSPSDVVAPGLLGFLVVVALGVALWLLLRSLNKHLGRVKPDDDAAEDDGVTEGTVETVDTVNHEESAAGHKISP